MSTFRIVSVNTDRVYVVVDSPQGRFGQFLYPVGTDRAALLASIKEHISTMLENNRARDLSVLRPDIGKDLEL